MRYIVKKSDLIGDIRNFPLEIVQKMVDYQIIQDSFCDMTIFQENVFDGFYWNNTLEGPNFWEMVIVKKNFDRFFEKYPKEENKFKFGDLIEASFDQITWHRRYFVCYTNVLSIPYLISNFFQDSPTIEGTYCKFIRPIKEFTKRLTLDEIARKYDVDKIEIIKE